DFERVVAAVAVLVEPFADRITKWERSQLCGPLAAVGIDAPNLAEPFEEDVGGLRHDDKMERNIGDHDPRHAVRNAAITGIIALAASGDVGKARLQNFLVFGLQWSLLPQAPGLRRIIVTAAHPRPLTFPVRESGIVEGLRPAD